MKAGDFDIVEVVAKCKKNDRKSQYIIYDRYYGKMMGVALRYFRNQDIACDIVQESFIKAFSKIEQFKGGTNFEGWLKRIVVNRALDELRKNKNVTFNYLGYLGIILVLHSIYLLIIQFNSEIPNIYGFEINEKLFFINFLISLIVLSKSGFLDD